jgi:hypothetical protein
LALKFDQPHVPDGPGAAAGGGALAGGSTSHLCHLGLFRGAHLLDGAWARAVALAVQVCRPRLHFNLRPSPSKSGFEQRFPFF